MLGTKRYQLDGSDLLVTPQSIQELSTATPNLDNHSYKLLQKFQVMFIFMGILDMALKIQFA